MKHLCIAAAFAVAAFTAPAGAANLPTSLELRLQTIESRLPEPGRIDELASKVRRLAQSKGVALKGSAAAKGGAGGGDVLFSLYQDVQALQKEIRSLRGEIQELKHAFEQRKKRQRDLYVNLSKRLKVIEQKLGIRPGSSSRASSGGDKSNRNQSGKSKKGAKQAYNAAFDLLSAGKFDQASASFEQFVKTYPHSEYADNAWYWLGNARYINREYDAALAALRHVLNDFPGSPKASGALYKIGVVQDELGKFDQARNTLNRVIDKYPDSNAADLARERLDAMTDG